MILSVTLRKKEFNQLLELWRFPEEPNPAYYDGVSFMNVIKNNFFAGNLESIKISMEVKDHLGILVKQWLRLKGFDVKEIRETP